MNNKRIEERLKKDVKYSQIIMILEKCEAGQVQEIRISKEEGFTDSAVLDRMILTYLKKLKVDVVYIEPSTEIEEDENATKCQHEIHRVLESSMKKGTKIKTFLKGNHKMLKMDMSSFVICPSCNAIKEVK